MSSNNEPLRAVNIYTLETAEVVKIDGALYHLRRQRYLPRNHSAGLGVFMAYTDPWHVRDFWSCWRTEGSREYATAIRNRRGIYDPWGDGLEDVRWAVAAALPPGDTVWERAQVAAYEVEEARRAEPLTGGGA